MLESDEPKTIAQAIRDLNLKETSVWNIISQNRKKGNDFTAFIDQEAKSLLHANKIAVYRSVLDQAVSRTSTSHNQQKLFTLLVGDTKESTSINIGTLTVGVNVSALPVETSRDKGVIDAEPYVPKGK
jgi:hypothetical protein